MPAALVAPDIWGEVRQRLDSETVRAVLDALSPLQREAIELAYFGGLTQTEVSDRTGRLWGPSRAVFASDCWRCEPR